MNGHVLQRVDEVMDLGIFFDSKLCFDVHVNYIFRKCSRLLGFIFRACANFKIKKSFDFLYNALIRSILEYGSVILSLSPNLTEYLLYNYYVVLPFQMS